MSQLTFESETSLLKYTHLIEKDHGLEGQKNRPSIFMSVSQ